jgi:hypothetical protein
MFLQDSGTSTDVQLHFRIAHFVTGACPSGHSSLIGVDGPVADVLSINLFDLQVARAISGTEASLTEYFANFTPRNLGGNETGGTYLVHSQPAPICAAPDCPNHFQPEFIETRWPKLLQINPDTGAQPRLTLARTFTVSDYQGVVTYELVGTVLFHVAEKHYTSKIVIKDMAFDYDGMGSGGALVPVGPADLICHNDPRAVMWMFHRTSDCDVVGIFSGVRSKLMYRVAD